MREGYVEKSDVDAIDGIEPRPRVWDCRGCGGAGCRACGQRGEVVASW